MLHKKMEIMSDYVLKYHQMSSRHIPAAVFQSQTSFAVSYLYRFTLTQFWRETYAALVEP